jgi:hypothetical protein
MRDKFNELTIDRVNANNEWCAVWFSSHSTGCLRGRKRERKEKRKEKGRDCRKSSTFSLLYTIIIPGPLKRGPGLHFAISPSPEIVLDHWQSGMITNPFSCTSDLDNLLLKLESQC